MGQALAIAATDPRWSHAPSPFHWQVLCYGGTNPRTGFEQPPLEFQFFAKHYTRRQIEQRAADLCEREHRTSFIIREPVGADVVALAKGQRVFGRIAA